MASSKMTSFAVTGDNVSATMEFKAAKYRGLETNLTMVVNAPVRKVMDRFFAQAKIDHIQSLENEAAKQLGIKLGSATAEDRKKVHALLHKMVRDQVEGQEIDAFAFEFALPDDLQDIINAAPDAMKDAIEVSVRDAYVKLNSDDEDEQAEGKVLTEQLAAFVKQASKALAGAKPKSKK